MDEKVIVPPNIRVPRESLIVKIMTPSHFLFYGEALAVSSANSLGKFDILPEHANFITLVENSPIVITKADKQKVQFRVHQAIVHSSRNRVSIYAEPVIG